MFNFLLLAIAGILNVASRIFHQKMAVKTLATSVMDFTYVYKATKLQFKEDRMCILRLVFEWHMA